MKNRPDRARITLPYTTDNHKGRKTMKTNLDTADLAVTAAALVVSLLIARAFVPEILPGSDSLLFALLATAIFLFLAVCWRLLTRKRRREK